MLERMFWLDIREAGKQRVLLCSGAACVPSCNNRHFFFFFKQKTAYEIAAKILSNYCTGLDAKDADPRRKTAIGLAQRGDLYATAPEEVMPNALAMLGEKLGKENDSDIQSLLSAAFARFGQEACARRKYKAVAELCYSLERVAQRRPALVQDLRSRVGIENRLPEMIEEAINADQVPEDLINVLQQLPRSSVEHLADPFFRAQNHVECYRIVELVGELGQPAIDDLRDLLRPRQPR